MRVVRLRAPGRPQQLSVEEADRPRPGPGEALVRAHAAITRNELQWPVDRLPAIPSYELSGVVEEAAAGDEVFALIPFDRDGVAADYTTVSTGLLVARPRGLTHAESAAIPLPALDRTGISPCRGTRRHGHRNESTRRGQCDFTGTVAATLTRPPLPSESRPGGAVAPPQSFGFLARARSVRDLIG